MKAYSKYVFFQNEEHPSVYILQNMSGVDVLKDKLDVYKRGVHTGKKKLSLAQSGSGKAAAKYEKSLLVSTGSITGVNFNTLYPTKAVGDYGKDCILLELSDNGKVLTLYFIKNKAIPKQAVFDKWLNGELIEIVDSELLPLNNKKTAD